MIGGLFVCVILLGVGNYLRSCSLFGTTVDERRSSKTRYNSVKSQSSFPKTQVEKLVSISKCVRLELVEGGWLFNVNFSSFTFNEMGLLFFT